MITSRPSNDILHTDVILEKITEFDIFKFYCPRFIELNKKFCSELREDKRPSASIVNYNGNLLYKDFGYPDHTFNCFGYVQFKYGVTFTQALIRISTDFNLKLASTNGIVQSKTPKPFKICFIRRINFKFVTEPKGISYCFTRESALVNPIVVYGLNCKGS